MARSLASTGRLRVSSSREVVLYEDVSLLYHLESFGLLSAHHEFCASRIRALESVRSPITVDSAAFWDELCGLCAAKSASLSVTSFPVIPIWSGDQRTGKS